MNTRYFKAVINNIKEGIIAIDADKQIDCFNARAGRITGINPKEAIGKALSSVMPRCILPNVIETGKPQFNHEVHISAKKKIIANSIPVLETNGVIIGAVIVFTDITHMYRLTNQNSALKEMRGLLGAIIDASLGAISVVDKTGLGLLINPAYTRLTGLSPQDVIGKPAEFDIAEGESAHMRVLKTRNPVRNAKLKLKPHNKEVLANVAPVIADGQLKGSVAIVHDLSELKSIANELSTAKRIIRTLSSKYTFSDIVGQSYIIRTAIQWAKKAASVPATVLLEGESGTGKELFAHAIHHASSRRNKRFIRINCSVLVESLLESELFGYVEGAFTGARRGGKKGLIEEAHKGTLFFDEVSELSPNTQAKLLRVLQEKEIVCVGGSKPIPVDVRIIAATHVDLETAVREKRFRHDLYYRLNVMPIKIPPLRDRLEDIEPIAYHIIAKINEEFGRNVMAIHPQTLKILHTHRWDGNVRELENVLAQAITRMRFGESTILPGHLPPLRSPQAFPTGAGAIAGKMAPADDLIDLKTLVRYTERACIRKALETCKWDKTAAAKMLGISIRGLYNKMHRLGID